MSLEATLSGLIVRPPFFSTLSQYRLPLLISGLELQVEAGVEGLGVGEGAFPEATRSHHAPGVAAAADTN